MSTPERKAGRADGASHQPPPSDAPADAPAQAGTDEDAGASSAEASSQGSPAAPVMKQFAKTDAESGGRR